MSDPKDRSGPPPSKSFDQGWDEILADTTGTNTAASPDGTKAWTEEVRGARKRDADADESASATPASTDEATASTKVWTEEVRASGKKEVEAEDSEAGEETSDSAEMDRLMASPVATPSDDDDEEVEPAASTSLVGGRLPDAPAPKAAPDDDMARMMGLASDASPDGDAEEAAALAEPDATASEVSDAFADEAEDEAPSSDDGDGDEEPEPPIVLHPDRSLPETTAEPAEEAGGGRWLWLVGAAAAVGIGVAAMGGPEASPASDASATKAAVAPVAAPAAAPVVAPSDAKPPADAALATTKPPPTEDVPPAADAKPPAADPNRDPREPPPGTPPDIAAVFKKIPVSPADRAPVGGVGKTGVHVDDVAMGSGYARSRCTGDGTTFSVGNDGLANVCIRVVHQRQKEELTVIWQKHEGNARRGKIVVKPAHAYRTRAYLKLRSEYVGDWTVKIMSTDGVELAAHDFSIAP
ncbi:MAG: DUF2914 domain-containing protein [Myxococcota bacterium]